MDRTPIPGRIFQWATTVFLLWNTSVYQLIILHYTPAAAIKSLIQKLKWYLNMPYFHCGATNQPLLMPPTIITSIRAGQKHHNPYWYVKWPTWWPWYVKWPTWWPTREEVRATENDLQTCRRYKTCRPLAGVTCLLLTLLCRALLTSLRRALRYVMLGPATCLFLCPTLPHSLFGGELLRLWRWTNLD